ncbi:MAG TPA: hypothetical protein PLB91_07555 [Spirochaetales bacterium]|nr:hypothetical protein [Spirochaetales bacterium]HRY54733.1 hypothetical protein [Spirochaetia bacterium]HRZ64988.1 hypothetical protein [Spirochaetia bacterium]
MRLHRSLAAGLVLALGSSLGAEPAALELDGGRAVVLASPREAASEGFADFLAQALAQEAEAAGLTLAPSLEGEYGAEEPAAAKAAAAGSGARWVLAASCAIEGSRLLWRAAVYDGARGELLGSDGFSAYAGLTALPLLAGSAEAALAAARIGGRSSADDAAPPISFRLSFASSDRGALLSLGEGEASFPLGEVGESGLEAPYLPFKPGQRLVFGLEKEGFWPARKSFVVKDEEREIALPRLQPKTRMAAYFSYGSSRRLGAAAALRWYPVADWVYLRAEDAFWCAYDFLPGSRPVFHDELRLGSGAYLFLSPSSPFRLSAGLGFSGIATWVGSSGLEQRSGFDLCLEPFFWTLEWHRGPWALVLEQRLLYSLGSEGGFLARGWAESPDGVPFLALGVLLKW